VLAVSLRAAGGCANGPAGLSDSAGFSACRATGSAVVGPARLALCHRRLLNSRRGQRHDQGSRRIELFRDMRRRHPERRRRRSTSRNACSVRAVPAAPHQRCQKRPHQQQPHRRLRGRSGTVSGPMNTGLPEFAGGSWALGSDRLGMAWILALFTGSQSQLALFLRREVDEVFKRTSSARDAEGPPRTAEYFGQCIRSLADRDDDQTASRPPGEAPDAIVRGMALIERRYLTRERGSPGRCPRRSR